MLPRRKRDAQKGNFGRLLCITGSGNMPGACALSTTAALRSGAGLVTVATAAENPARLASAMPEAMWLPMQTDEDGFLQCRENLAKLAPHLARANAVLLGCGLGVTEHTRALVAWVLEQAACPVVLDADGLNCLGDCISIDRRMGTDWILTPHPGEMARLTGQSVGQIQGNRTACATQFSQRYPSVTLVLKGAGTVVAAHPDALGIIDAGNAGMASGGMGDVLSGIIGALLGQKLSPYDAACAGCVAHGAAADVLAARFGTRGMLATDLFSTLQRRVTPEVTDKNHDESSNSPP